MAHKFRTDNLTDDERRRRAAGWVDTAVLDLERALALEVGHPGEAAVRALIAAAKEYSTATRPKGT